MKRTKERGITLLALIVTIIVLLILAGISIGSLLGKNGIINRALQAKDDKSESEELKIKISAIIIDYYNSKNSEGTLNRYIFNELSKDRDIEINGDTLKYKDKIFYLTENQVLVEMPNLLEGIKYGDIIQYEPEEKEYKWLGKYSGNSQDVIVNNKTNNFNLIKWKILDIKEDGTIDLIGEKATEGKLYLGNAQGYNNGVKLLNDVCNELYGDIKKGIKARSINLNDIENKMNEKALNIAHTNTNGEIVYNGQVSKPYTVYKNYPQIYSNEKLSVITRNETTIKNMDGLEMSEQNNFVEPSETSGIVEDATTIQPYRTYWWMYGSKDNKDKILSVEEAFKGDGEGKNNLNYNIIMPNGLETSYWIASRCVRAGETIADFSIRGVFGGGIYGYTMFKSDKYIEGGEMSIFPIVNIKSDLINKDKDGNFVVKNN